MSEIWFPFIRYASAAHTKGLPGSPAVAAESRLNIRYHSSKFLIAAIPGETLHPLWAIKLESERGHNGPYKTPKRCSYSIRNITHQINWKSTQQP